MNESGVCLGIAKGSKGKTWLCWNSTCLKWASQVDSWTKYFGFIFSVIYFWYLEGRKFTYMYVFILSGVARISDGDTHLGGRPRRGTGGFPPPPEAREFFEHLGKFSYANCSIQYLLNWESPANKSGPRIVVVGLE